MQRAPIVQKTLGTAGQVGTILHREANVSGQEAATA